MQMANRRHETTLGRDGRLANHDVLYQKSVAFQPGLWCCIILAFPGKAPYFKVAGGFTYILMILRLALKVHQGFENET